MFERVDAEGATSGAWGRAVGAESEEQGGMRGVLGLPSIIRGRGTVKVVPRLLMGA